MATPSSIINICSGVMLDSTYQNTIWFDSPKDQEDYFAGKVVKTFSAYSYLRKHWDIDVQATPEQALSWTYLFFKNGRNAKTYYYFINDIQYINENCVKLILELDVMQTYAFDYTLGRSFVDREHIALDNFGENLQDEGLDLGEYIVQDEHDVPLTDLCILILSSINPETTTGDTTIIKYASNIDGVFSGLSVYAVDLEDYMKLGAKLVNLDSWGKSDAIVSMWMYPKDLVRLSGAEWGDEVLCKSVGGIKSFDVGLYMFEGEKLGTYTPRNKKLLTHPYQLLYASNNTGDYAEYKFEYFDEPTFTRFTFSGAIAPEGTCKLYPLNYKGDDSNYEEGITLGGFPTCAWNQDVYKLWLAQNQHQNTLSYIQGGASILGGVISTLATGGIGGVMGMGSAIGGLNQIMGNLAKKKDMEVQPPQAKGNFSANVNIVNEKQTFTFQYKTITPYYAALVDDFFDLYGYKTNRVKIPNRHVRENWTYTKTIGCNIFGNMPMSDLSKIKSIFFNLFSFFLCNF